VQHKADDGRDRLAYPTSADDSHPNAAGLKKATAEFVPLLNAAYNAWRGEAMTTRPRDRSTYSFAHRPESRSATPHTARLGHTDLRTDG